MKTSIFIFSKKIFLLSILTFFLILIFIQFTKELVFFQDALKKNSQIKISAEKSIQEKFTAMRPNLTEVEILLGGGKKLNNPSAVKIKLADENCNEIIREGLAESSFLKRKDIYKFRFKKIVDSENRKYCLILEYKPQKSDAKNLQVYLLDNQPAMRAGYSNDTVWQNISELNQRISQYKPFFLKNYFLWFIFLSFIFFSVFLVVVLILV